MGIRDEHHAISRWTDQGALVLAPMLTLYSSGLGKLVFYIQDKVSQGINTTVFPKADSLHWPQLLSLESGFTGIPAPTQLHGQAELNLLCESAQLCSFMFSS